MEKVKKQDHQIRAEAEQDADPRIDLAVERTTLAWVRTVMEFITAG